MFTQGPPQSECGEIPTSGFAHTLVQICQVSHSVAIYLRIIISRKKKSVPELNDQPTYKRIGLVQYMLLESLWFFKGLRLSWGLKQVQTQERKIVVPLKHIIHINSGTANRLRDLPSQSTESRNVVITNLPCIRKSGGFQHDPRTHYPRWGLSWD